MKQKTEIKKTIDPNLQLAFRQIAPLLNEKILLESALETHCNYETVSDYVQGNITDNRFGMDLLEVIKIRIARHYATLGQNPIRQNELTQQLIESLEILNRRFDNFTHVLYETQELLDSIVRKANLQIQS